MRVSNGTPSCSSMVAACCSVSQSDVELLLCPTNGVMSVSLLTRGSRVRRGAHFRRNRPPMASRLDVGRGNDDSVFEVRGIRYRRQGMYVTLQGVDMGQDHAQEKAALIERIAEFARQRLGGAQAAQAERFVRYYYEASNADDLLALPPDDLYGAALSHWKLAQLRRPGEVLRRGDDPRGGGRGGQSTHTVIEVVMD